MPPYRQDSAPHPRNAAVLQLQAQPGDTNVQGDMFGGWLVMQMDIAGSITARRLAQGRVATVAIDSMVFLRPVRVGDLMSFHTEVLQTGSSSVSIQVEVWLHPVAGQTSKLTEGRFTFVAIDGQGRTRPLPVAPASQ
ncbi:acyl-CoA thioesterase YciA [Fluviicoccus keumensis]|uniref:Acyl-CoA thioesterase YciA n=1 Tax=Fluviicoccus keumensis TaxID=1435465 RepID=A0A4Q7ZCR5_9GAMM|nr:acyl-CoA thioesterase [Fluviicoccus keumensis]RZU47785.1 acyl-CoA thioesterase YciA [Fluviicoccus keumensis]